MTTLTKPCLAVLQLCPQTFHMVRPLQCSSLSLMRLH